MVVVTKRQVDVILNYLTKGAEKTISNMRNVNKNVEKQNKLFTQQQRTAKNFGLQVEQLQGIQRSHNLQLTKSGKGLVTNKNRLLSNSNALNNHIANNTGFFKTMGMSNDALNNFNQSGKKFTSIGGRMANRFRQATHGARGFRMEMLGTMFFGMALQRAMSGLMKTSLEWVGVFEILQVTLGVLFLPVAMEVLDWVMKFSDWIMNLDDSTKLFIGRMVLMAAGLGLAIFLFGTLALGIGSMIIAFKFLFSPFGIILGLLGTLLGMNFLGVFDGLKDGLDETGDSLTTFGVTGDALSKIKQNVGKFMSAAKAKFDELWPPIWEKIKLIPQKFLDGIHENSQKIADGIKDFLTAISNFIDQNQQKIIDIGLTIGEGLIKGIVKALGSIGKLVFKAGEQFGAKAGAGEFQFQKDIAEFIRTRKTIPELLREGSEQAREEGSFAIGGIVPKTGLFRLHQGEEVIPTKDVGRGQTIQVTYNVTVADKREFESMLRANNDKMARDIRRIIQT